MPNTTLPSGSETVKYRLSPPTLLVRISGESSLYLIGETITHDFRREIVCFHANIALLH